LVYGNSDCEKMHGDYRIIKSVFDSSLRILVVRSYLIVCLCCVVGSPVVIVFNMLRNLRTITFVGLSVYGCLITYIKPLEFRRKFVAHKIYNLFFFITTFRQNVFPFNTYQYSASYECCRLSDIERNWNARVENTRIQYVGKTKGVWKLTRLMCVVTTVIKEDDYMFCNFWHVRKIAKSDH
jgi:hypothetical protein